VRFRRHIWFAALLLILAVQAVPSAHDIPADTTVRIFIKPEGFRLHVLARVQMASINDIDWPLQKTTGYVDLEQVDPFLRDAGTMWISDYMDLYEGGRKLARPDVASVRLVPEGDQSFDSTYDAALAHMTGEKIPSDTTLFPLQGFLDVMFDYKITSPESSFSFNPRFDRLGLRVTTDLTFVRANGGLRAFEYVGLPGLIRLDPSPIEATQKFLELGFFHLLDHADALLFLLCLAVPFRRARGLPAVVAMFGVAYTLTFLAAAYGMAPDILWFQPLVALVLSVAVFSVALENIFGATIERRWMLALGFGLAFGFSFAAGVQPILQFAGSHPTTSILAFSVGIDAAVAIVTVLMAGALALALGTLVDERIGTIVLSALVAHSAWHALVTRYEEFRRYPLHWPAFDLLLLASVLRWMMAGIALAAIVWALRVSGLYGGSRSTKRSERAIPQPGIDQRATTDLH
jgi:hypothetical protein